jgi:UDP-N-acetylmuramoyl-tripeptide--D-alanyl-D-alanine ligase
MSLDTFNELWGKRKDIRKILVLGDMKELGSISNQEHKKIGEIVNSMDVDSVIYFGEYSKYFKGVISCNNVQEVVESLKKNIKKEENTVILLKGSNSQKLHTIPELLN